MMPTPAARLDAIFVDFRALPKALFGDRQQCANRLHHLHRHHVVVVSQRDPADAVRRAAHRAHIAFLEADRHAISGADEDLAAAIADLHRDHRVAVFHANGDNPACPGIAERRQRRLFHRATTRPHHDELVLFEFLHREHRRDALARFHRHEVRDRLAFAARPDVWNLMDLEPIRTAAVREKS